MGGALWDDEISVVVVSFNTRALTLRCVECLLACGGVREVCVVDNASQDGTVEALDSLAVPGGSRLVVRRLRENIGFPRRLYCPREQRCICESRVDGRAAFLPEGAS